MNSPDSPRDAASGEPDARIERLLASFAPRPSRLDRDRLMYLAGQAAVESAAVAANASTVSHASASPAAPRTPWYWPASTALSSACAAVLAVMLLVQASATRDSFRGKGPALAGPKAPTGSSQTNDATLLNDATLPNSPRSTNSPRQPNSERPARSSDSNPPSGPEVADAGAFPSLEVAPNSVLHLRAASFREGIDAAPPTRTGAGREEPPSTYLRAVRSVLDRPQSLSLELRY